MLPHCLRTNPEESPERRVCNRQTNPPRFGPKPQLLRFHGRPLRDRPSQPPLPAGTRRCAGRPPSPHLPAVSAPVTAVSCPSCAPRSMAARRERAPGLNHGRRRPSLAGCREPAHGGARGALPGQRRREGSAGPLGAARGGKRSSALRGAPPAGEGRGSVRYAAAIRRHAVRRGRNGRLGPAGRRRRGPEALRSSARPSGADGGGRASPCRTTWERTSARPRRRRRRTNPSAVSGGRGAGQGEAAAVSRGDPRQQRHKRRRSLRTSFCFVFRIGNLRLSCLVSALDEGDIALLKTYVSNAHTLLAALGTAEAAPRVPCSALGPPLQERH